jgi:pyruvate,orthophosphate dikinase
MASAWARASAADVAKVEGTLAKAREFHEANPMMGLRGCRLGVLWPEIYEMQARAIFQATAQLIKDGYADVEPEVMIPIVGIDIELEMNREMVVKVAEEVKKETGIDFPVVVGTMIELPRAALVADDIAKYAEFFSFGTNDLTQMTFGYSRDDAEAKFLHVYLEKKILKENPFQVLDRSGVGQLIRTAVALGRKTRPELVIGICGEHGGDPDSIEFCHIAGLNYVSCSPFRVPVARLAAAHAALDNPEK